MRKSDATLIPGLSEPADASKILPAYRCPSYSGASFSTDPLYAAGAVNYPNFAIRKYVGIGTRTVLGLSGAAPAEGCLFPQSKISLPDILDGTTNTMVIAETKDEKSAVWIDGTSAAVACRALGAPPTYAAPVVSIDYKPYFPGGVFPNSIGQEWGASSMHPAGAHHLFIVRRLRAFLVADHERYHLRCLGDPQRGRAGNAAIRARNLRPSRFPENNHVAQIPAQNACGSRRPGPFRK